MIPYKNKNITFINSLIFNLFLLFTLMLLISNSLKSHEESSSLSSEKEISNIIKDFLLKNPEVIIESLESYRESQIKIREEKRIENLALLYKQISSNTNYSIGSKNARVKLIEFIDYNCGYCKRTLEAILRLSKEDSDLQITFKDLPVLSQSSTLAAKAAISAGIQGYYIEMHSALLNHRGNIDNTFIITTAKNLGINIEEFKKDMNSKKTLNEISSNLEIAKELGINGTPTFIIGNNILPGAQEYDALKSIIAEQKDAL